MTIKKITIFDRGIRGMEVHYYEPEVKDGRPCVTSHKVKKPYPIHLGLERLIKDLRYHMLDICGAVHDDMDKAIKDMLITESYINSIDFDNEYFRIKGESSAFEDKHIPRDTRKVDENDNYEHYASVRALIDTIVEETKEYMAGTKQVEDEEIIARYASVNHKEDEFSADKLASLSPEQLKDMASKIIERGYGGVILWSGVEVDEALANQEIEEIKAEFDLSVGGDEIVIPIDEAKKPKKEKKEKAVAVELPKDEEAF